MGWGIVALHSCGTPRCPVAPSAFAGGAITSSATARPTHMESKPLPAHHKITGSFWQTRVFENLWDTWKVG